MLCIIPTYETQTKLETKCVTHCVTYTLDSTKLYKSHYGNPSAYYTRCSTQVRSETLRVKY